jgi:hypothetical protein
MFCSSNIIRMMKQRMMRWAECELHMGEQVYTYRVLASISEGKSTISGLIRRLEVSFKKNRR